MEENEANKEKAGTGEGSLTECVRNTKRLLVGKSNLKYSQASEFCLARSPNQCCAFPSYSNYGIFYSKGGVVTSGFGGGEAPIRSRGVNILLVVLLITPCMQ